MQSPQVVEHDFGNKENLENQVLRSPVFKSAKALQSHSPITKKDAQRERFSTAKYEQRIKQQAEQISMLQHQNEQLKDQLQEEMRAKFLVTRERELFFREKEKLSRKLMVAERRLAELEIVQPPSCTAHSEEECFSEQEHKASLPQSFFDLELGFQITDFQH